jgi:hypothetical protein
VQKIGDLVRENMGFAFGQLVVQASSVLTEPFHRFIWKSHKTSLLFN